MKKVLTFILGIFMSASAFGTAQSPDRIIYDGKTYALYSNPLELYFEENPERRPTNGVVHTGMWRGYVATFEVIDNEVFVKDIEILIEDPTSEGDYDLKWISVLNEVFSEDQPIKLDWFTGLLVLPYGELIDYVHMGYASTYENYILLEVENGNLNRSEEMDYQEYTAFKSRQFEAFRKTEDYEELMNKLSKGKKRRRAFVDGFLQQYVIEYTSKILTD